MSRQGLELLMGHIVAQQHLTSPDRREHRFNGIRDSAARNQDRLSAVLMSAFGSFRSGQCQSPFSLRPC